MNCAVRYLLIRLRRSQLVPPERHGPSLEIVQRCGAGLTLQDQGLGLGSQVKSQLCLHQWREPGNCPHLLGEV